MSELKTLVQAIRATVIGGSVTGGAAVITTTGILRRAIGGLCRDVQEHGDMPKENGWLLRTGQWARIAEDAKGIPVAEVEAVCIAAGLSSPQTAPRQVT